MAEDEPTEAEIKEEEAGADDPELQELDQAEPEEVEEEGEDDDLSNAKDLIDEEKLVAEKHDPADDGDDSILQELIPDGK